jgi:hypothetical protein
VADALEWRWGGDVADETVEEAHDVWRVSSESGQGRR